MKKTLSKKVIIITTIIIIFGITIVLLNYLKPKQSNLDQQYIATATIDLPDGSSVEAELDMLEQKTQSWIGTQLTDLTPAIKQHLDYPDHYGVYVQDTFRNSPAQTAGILPGDIITKINNIEARDVLPTINLIAALHPGDTYPVAIFRQGKYLIYSVTVSDKQTDHF